MAQWATGSPWRVYIYMGDPSGEARKSHHAGMSSSMAEDEPLEILQLYSPELSCPAGHRAGGVLNIGGKRKNCSSLICFQLLNLELETTPSAAHPRNFHHAFQVKSCNTVAASTDAAPLGSSLEAVVHSSYKCQYFPGLRQEKNKFLSIQLGSWDSLKMAKGL